MIKELSYVPILEDTSNIFSSYDLGCVCSLVALNYKLLRIDKTHGAKALFLFESSDDLVESAQMYWRGELQVNALKYFNALKNTKNRLYSE